MADTAALASQDFMQASSCARNPSLTELRLHVTQHERALQL
jgi:hypothetical protein